MYKLSITFWSVYGTKDFILHFAANFTLDSHFSYSLQDLCHVHKHSKDTWYLQFSTLSRDESLSLKTKLSSCKMRLSSQEMRTQVSKDKTPVMWKDGNLPLSNTVAWFF